jgi:hypothetical protein
MIAQLSADAIGAETSDLLLPAKLAAEAYAEEVARSPYSRDLSTTDGSLYLPGVECAADDTRGTTWCYVHKGVGSLRQGDGLGAPAALAQCAE